MMSAKLIFTGIAVAFTFLTVTVQAATTLAPHRAVYSVSMAQGVGTGMVTDVDGIMVMTMERTCDGWIFSQDMKIVISLAEGNPVQQTAFFTSWESLDGLEYRFASKFQNNNTIDELRGRAELNPDGSGGKAWYSKPEKTNVDLPEGTMFPVSHTVWLIDEALSGVRYASGIVFAGTEEFKPELVNAFIGNVVEVGEHDAGRFGQLGGRRGWPVSMAFFPVNSDSGMPNFELYALQLDNGVSTELKMNFGDFSTNVQAEKLEAIEMPICQ